MVRLKLLLPAFLLLAGTCVAGSGAAPAASTVVARIPTGGNPCGVAGAGGAVWVTEVQKGELLRIDPRTLRIAAVVRVGTSPVNLDVVGGEVWVPDDRGDTLSRISIATNQVVEMLKTDANPAVVAPVEGEVWASMFDAGSVWRIRPG